MKALVLKEYRRLVVEDVPVPAIGASDVLVAVKACGICGSDVHGMDGSTGRRRPPVIMGHEASGVIARIGDAVDGWKVGDRVTFDSTIWCGHCEFCRRGQVNLCNNRRVFGVSCEEYRQQGAFAEFVAVPQRLLYRLPEGLPFEHAALVEPFSIAVHATRRVTLNRDDRCVVVGAGMIGLALIQALRVAGCERIIAVDVVSERLALAETLGATTLLNPATTDVLKDILRWTNGSGADVAFEAVGVASTVDLAVQSVRKGGSVTLVGNAAPQVHLPLQRVVTRELTLLGSCACSGEYPICLEMMSRGAIRPEKLLSACAPLSEGPSWFARLYRKEPGLLKVVLIP